MQARLLAEAELFAALDRVALARLASYVEPLAIPAGETVVRQGEPADGLYIVASGAFGVFASAPDDLTETRLGVLRPGDCFGEMALLTDEPRAATVRADTDGEVLRLERGRFLDLTRREPEVALSVAATPSRRLRKADEAIVEQDRIIARGLDQALAPLPPGRRRRVLEAAILDRMHPEALRTLFGEAAGPVARDLAELGIAEGRPSPSVLGILRGRLEREIGPDGLRSLARGAAARLAEAGCWDEALSVLARHAPRPDFVAALGRAHRAAPALPGDRAMRWVERLTDEEAAEDADLALSRAALHRERGDSARAVRVLQRALGQVLLAGDSAEASRLGEEIARSVGKSGASAGGLRYGLQMAGVLKRRPGGRRAPLAAALAVGLVGVAVLANPGPRGVFVLVLAAAIVLWASELFAWGLVGLGLVALWILLGVATPAQAVAGFGSLDWVFVVAIFGLGSAVARSGLLLRVGLALIRRMPPGLFGQAATLLLTGVVLSPLLPMVMGRAALTAPLALAVSDALRLRAREPAAAVLGLATWIGAGPLVFLFLGASPVTLLTWGLLPEASRQRFEWVHWFVAALPLAACLGLGGLAALFLVLRPAGAPALSRERLDLQLAMLGPLTKREWAMVAILPLTVAGWVAAPALRLEVGTVALLGLLGAALARNFDGRSLQELDWDYLIFFGVALSLGRLISSLGLDRSLADAAGRQMSGLGVGPLPFVLSVAFLTVLARLVLLPEPAILLVTLAVLPIAPSVGVEPWVAIVTILATYLLWYIPSQTPEYLVAYSGSEGRLYSHAQARRVSFAYAAVTLAGLALSVPYWHLLGLL